MKAPARRSQRARLVPVILVIHRMAPTEAVLREMRIDPTVGGEALLPDSVPTHPLDWSRCLSMALSEAVRMPRGRPGPYPRRMIAAVRHLQASRSNGRSSKYNRAMKRSCARSKKRLLAILRFIETVRCVGEMDRRSYSIAVNVYGIC